MATGETRDLFAYCKRTCTMYMGLIDLISSVVSGMKLADFDQISRTYIQVNGLDTRFIRSINILF